MNTSQIYIVMSVVVLAVIALFAVFVGKNKKDKKLTPLAGLAFGFILAGIIFVDNRLFGYGLIGVGIILAIIDIFKKLKNK